MRLSGLVTERKVNRDEGSPTERLSEFFLRRMHPPAQTGKISIRLRSDCVKVKSSDTELKPEWNREFFSPSAAVFGCRRFFILE